MATIKRIVVIGAVAALVVVWWLFGSAFYQIVANVPDAPVSGYCLDHPWEICLDRFFPIVNGLIRTFPPLAWVEAAGVMLILAMFVDDITFKWRLKHGTQKTPQGTNE